MVLIVNHKECIKGWELWGETIQYLVKGIIILPISLAWFKINPPSWEMFHCTGHGPTNWIKSSGRENAITPPRHKFKYNNYTMIKLASSLKNHLGLLERWLSGCKDVLLLQKAIQSPAPTLGGSQAPVTVIPENPVPSFDVCQYMHTCVQRHTHQHKQNKSIK